MSGEKDAPVVTCASTALVFAVLLNVTQALQQMLWTSLCRGSGCRGVSGSRDRPCSFAFCEAGSRPPAQPLPALTQHEHLARLKRSFFH